MAKLVSKVYGDAYVSVVSEKNNLIDALEEIKSVKNILLENVEIIELLDSPKMDDEEKIDFIKGIFENRISVDSLGFLLTIIEKKELLLIGKATVTTALPLDDSKKERIVDELLKSSHYKSLEVSYVVDESIIGGIVIRIGDRVVDSSVKTRIDKMRKMLS